MRAYLIEKGERHEGGWTIGVYTSETLARVHFDVLTASPLIGKPWVDARTDFHGPHTLLRREAGSDYVALLVYPVDVEPVEVRRAKEGRNP